MSSQRKNKKTKGKYHNKSITQREKKCIWMMMSNLIALLCLDKTLKSMTWHKNKMIH